MAGHSRPKDGVASGRLWPRPSTSCSAPDQQRADAPAAVIGTLCPEPRRPLSSNRDHPNLGLQRWSVAPSSVRFSQKSHKEAVLLEIRLPSVLSFPIDGT